MAEDLAGRKRKRNEDEIDGGDGDVENGLETLRGLFDDNCRALNLDDAAKCRAWAILTRIWKEQSAESIYGTDSDEHTVNARLVASCIYLACRCRGSDDTSTDTFAFAGNAPINIVSTAAVLRGCKVWIWLQRSEVDVCTAFVLICDLPTHVAVSAGSLSRFDCYL